MKIKRWIGSKAKALILGGLIFCMVISLVTLPIKAGNLKVVEWINPPKAGYNLEANTIYKVTKTMTIGHESSGYAGLETSGGGNSSIVIYIPKGVTLTVIGANGASRQGGRAAIGMLSGNLIVTGGGSLILHGGDGGSAKNGANGTGGFSSSTSIVTGKGGDGGHGAGGGGAGIGGDGGPGGHNNINAGGNSTSLAPWHSASVKGAGATWSAESTRNGDRGSGMGNLYVLGDLSISGSVGLGGAPGKGGNAGGWDDPSSSPSQPHFRAGGGGGGGGGAAGLDAPTLFGGGGAGGGAGGAGGGGGYAYTASGTPDDPSGKGGVGGRGKINGENGRINGSSNSGPSQTGGGPGGAAVQGSLYSSRANVAGRNRDYAVTSHTDIEYPVFLNNKSADFSGTVDLNATLGVALPIITTPKKAGYSFKGYFTEENGQGKQYISHEGKPVSEWDIIANNTILYAHWQIDEFSYNQPNDIERDGITASVAFEPATKAPYDSNVMAEVTLNGVATKSGVHAVTLKSNTIGSVFNLSYSSFVSKGNNFSEAKRATFKIPAKNIEDFILTHEVITTPDLYNQTYNYDGERKSYTIPTSFGDIDIGELKYEKQGGGNVTTTPPKDVGEYIVTIPVQIKNTTEVINLVKQLTIVPKLLEWDVTDLKAKDKDFDGTTDAQIEGNIKVKGVVAGDDVQIDSASITKGTFDSAVAESNKIVNVEIGNVTLVGKDMINYSLSTIPPILKASVRGIEPIIVSKITNPKVTFDGTVREVYDLVDFVDPNVSSVVLDGVQEKNLEYIYYTNAGCTAMTSLDNGANYNGGAPTNAGIYWIKVIFKPEEGQAQYSTVTSSAIPYIIEKKAITPHVEWMPNQDGYIYDHATISHSFTGAKLTPKVVIYDSSSKLVELEENKDYTITYQNNTNVTEGAKANITLKGNYDGADTKLFKIIKAVYDMSPVIMSNQTVAYDKRTHNVAIDDLYALLKIDTNLSVEYTYKGIENTTYLESETPPKDTGTYEVKAIITTSSSNWEFPGNDKTQYIITAKLKIVDTFKEITFVLNGGNIANQEDDIIWQDAPQYKLMKDYPGGVPKPKYAGYQLVGWENDGVLYRGSKIDEEEIQKDRTYKAIWQEKNIPVNFDANGGTFQDNTSVKKYEQQYQSELEYGKIAVPSKEHQKFIGWGTSVDSKVPLSGKFLFDDLQAGGKTYYAIWDTNTYYITMHYNGGKDTIKQEQKILEIPYGKKVSEAYTSIEEPTITGEVNVFTFKGWIDANDSTGTTYTSAEILNKTPEKDAVYIAKWDGDMISIHYRNYNAGSGSVSYSVPKLGSGTKPASPKPVEPEGKKFDKWLVTSSDDPIINIGDTFTSQELFNVAVKGDIEFEAVFTAKDVRVEFDLNGGNLVSGSLVQSLKYGNAPTNIIAKKEGHVLYRWLNLTKGNYIDKEELENEVVKENTAYIAQWQTDMKDIVFDANGGNTNKTVSIKNGEIINVDDIVPPSKENSSFIGWASTKVKADAKVVDIQGEQRIEKDTKYFAVWENITFVVRFQNEDGSKILEKEVLKNAKIDSVFTSEPVSNLIEGSNFMGWKQGGNVTILKWADIKSQTVTTNTIYTANFEKNEFTLTFDANGGIGGPLKVKEAYGKKVLLGEYLQPIPPAGYIFKGWYDKPIEGVLLSEYTFVSNQSVYAQYALDKANYTYEYYEQNLEDNLYTLVKSEKMSGNTQDQIKLQTPERVGFNIELDKTVYSDSQTNDSTTPLVVKGDGSLVIRLFYKRNIYEVNYTTEGNDITIPDGYNGLYRYGEEVKIKDNLKAEGYGFEGWYSNGITIVNNSFNMPAINVELKGKFNANQFMVRYELENVSGTSIVDNTKYKVGDEVSLPAKVPEKEGYQFAGWQSDDVELKAKKNYFIMPAKDIVIKASWKKELLTISFDTDGGSSVNPLQVGVNESVQLPQAPTKKGGRFVGWSVDNALYEAEAEYRVYKSPKQFVAKWAMPQYEITYELNGGSLDAVPMTVYESGKSYELLKPKREGYEFLDWFEDPAFTQEKNNITAYDQQDFILYAKWQKLEEPTKINYKVTYHLDEEAAVASSYIKGNTNSLLQATKEGYHFKGWYLEKEFQNVVENLSVNNQNDIDLYAKWEKTGEGHIVIPTDKKSDKIIQSWTSPTKEVITIVEGKNDIQENTDSKREAPLLGKNNQSKLNSQQEQCSLDNLWWLFIGLGGGISIHFIYVFLKKKKEKVTI